MLNSSQEIKDFKGYQAAGGLQKSPSYHLAIATIPLSEQIKAQLLDAVNSDLNYNADGINGLPEAMLALSNEAADALVAAKSMVSYLDIAAVPTDIEQVAIGVEIIRKLGGTENKEPAPSLLPITDSSKITALKTSLTTLQSHVPNAVALMIKINSAITPIPSIPPAPQLPAPQLSKELKQQALAMISILNPLVGTIKNKAAPCLALIDNAIDERRLAVIAFNDCIAFTMLNGQKNKPTVSGAAEAIYPKVVF